jgi:methylated-DNA-[protein]-cysteine S-methyltransferase
VTILTLHVEQLSSVLGPMLLLTDDQQNLRMVDWVDCQERMDRLLRRQYGLGRTRTVPSSRRTAARDAMEAYFSGDLTAIDRLPVANGGTNFQRQVWAALRTIPAGQTCSYGQLAAAIDRPKAVRALGLANAANPIAIVVPCHRVIGANGALTGYRSGLARKRWLLDHEVGLEPAPLI